MYFVIEQPACLLHSRFPISLATAEVWMVRLPKAFSGSDGDVSRLSCKLTSFRDCLVWQIAALPCPACNVLRSRTGN